MTRGKSAVVRNYSSDSYNFKAIQRLNAGDLIFAYLVGLIEGDGWFSITKNGEYLQYEVGLEMHQRDIQLLYKIKGILGVGTIHIKSREGHVMYRIKNKSHLKDIIIPIFDKYPMFSNKQHDYLRFRESLLNNIIHSKDLIDYTRPLKPFNTTEDILESSYFKYWLIGFIEAESSFSICTPAMHNSKGASFSISTNAFILIEAIRKELSLTTSTYMESPVSFKLKASNVRSIENIINYLKNNPIK